MHVVENKKLYDFIIVEYAVIENVKDGEEHNARSIISRAVSVPYWPLQGSNVSSTMHLLNGNSEDLAMSIINFHK